MSQSTQSLRESLSAAVDDEAQELELRRVLNAVQADAELGGRWERLHLISSMIRGEAASRPNQSRRSGLDRPWLAEAAPETTTADGFATVEALARPAHGQCRSCSCGVGGGGLFRR